MNTINLDIHEYITLDDDGNPVAYFSNLLCAADTVRLRNLRDGKVVNRKIRKEWSRQECLDALKTRAMIYYAN